MFTACAMEMCAISGSVLNQAITFDAVGFFRFCFFFLVIYMHRQILRILTTAHLSHNHLRLNIDIQMNESVQNVRFFSLFDSDSSWTVASNRWVYSSISSNGIIHMHIWHAIDEFRLSIHVWYIFGSWITMRPGRFSRTLSVSLTS